MKTEHWTIQGEPISLGFSVLYINKYFLVIFINSQGDHVKCVDLADTQSYRVLDPLSAEC